MRTVYVNGDYVAEDQATISIFDRGFLFADAVYEATAVIDGRLVDFTHHMDRLDRSLGEMGIEREVSRDHLLAMHRELIARNDLQEGIVYMQVTRGAADRDFAYPPPGTPTSLISFTQHKILVDNPMARIGLKVVTLPDRRWARCDIKTVQLVYASMAKVEARSRGADDAWLVRDGKVTEGTSNNVWLVRADDTIVTRELSSSILPGITRRSVIEGAERLGMKVFEEAFTTADVLEAKEAFITSAGTFVLPVVRVDDKPIGSGEPGPVAVQLREDYLAAARGALT